MAHLLDHQDGIFGFFLLSLRQARQGIAQLPGAGHNIFGLIAAGPHYQDTGSLFHSIDRVPPAKFGKPSPQAFVLEPAV